MKSVQGTKFRQWATARLREYIVKGLTMNDDLLKEAGVEQFNVLLADLKLAGSGQAMRTKGLKTHQLIYINDVVLKSMVLKNARILIDQKKGSSTVSPPTDKSGEFGIAS